MFRENLNFLNVVQELYAKDKAEAGIALAAFEPDDFLMTQASLARHVYIIQSGVCKVTLEEENGKAYILDFLSTGELLGELEVIRDEPRLCSVQALGEVVAYKMTKAYFMQQLQKDLKLNSMLLEAFAERITNTSKKASFQKLYAVEDMLKKVMALQESTAVNISKADLSAYLGISVRSLNRSLKRLQEEEGS
ncbi:Crp/Fnr family transcriptional regulator [Leeuwenhoekiella marinoflava]|uniref:CRP-like cAMP-binding protein n=2 Tax=Leeuwenhoekiella marinoflava TaxID=988 RepID=A0A4Q0PFR5_9FLAO|nr:Crp/Fnr family transcriptional regulator [Leeuwenhoekiella marinoflava]RXG25438.1 CRP-like cAMP-binding protein [Leeuwenhoekiella marinoflava]SHF87052.1 cAMP-binding domain of CRP or a regulatory subunit of cAMP-dependent protein kinases [Leeuwenhoekiella marinoflava DSM 3653]